MELPYACDYSKSYQSTCRGCQQKIVKDILRLAIILQAPTCDRKFPNWYHFQCFFIEYMPQSTRDIEGFDSLQWKDQKEIENIITVGESPYASQEKRSQLKRDLAKTNSQATVNNYSIEYTKIGRTKCDHCEVLIKKPELRIIKQVSKKKMYHLNCFIQIREKLEFLESGSEIQGFNDLKEEDKNLINQELPAIYETPKKKKRPSSESESQQEISYSQEEMISKNYNEIMHNYRQEIKENLNRDEIKKLLKHNGQHVSAKSENLLDRASDMLTYGALLRCRNCRGQLIFSSNGYKCFSSKDAWTKCNFITIDPIRNYVEIPEDMRLKHDFLYKYEYVERKRIFLQRPQENIIMGPLRCKNIYIHGFSSEETAALYQRVKNLGGRVVNEIHRSVFCVITTNEKVELLTEIIQQAKKMDVYVVNKEFLDNLSLEESLNDDARKYSLVPWGSELHQRIPEEFRKNKPGTSYHRNLEEEESGRRVMKIKNGIGIEPDSGLDDKAHVYQSGAVIFNAVLNKCDIKTNMNSFYKIQLLEDDETNEYWLYRGWGRTGTKSGSCKVQAMSTLKEAKHEFKNLFKNLTGNTWENRYGFIKKPDKYNYIEVNYEAKKEEIQDLNGSVASSNLKPAVAQLMAMIFNMQAMEKLMFEYELNLETMPLGKLSRAQIRNAYNVLTEVSWTFQRKSDPEEILYHTNKFYSFMPHNSKSGKPPLLDNKEIVKKKAEMLANLMEIETAYRIIERGASGQSGNTLDAYYNQLKVNIEPLEENCDEFKFITDYVNNTHADTHRNYDLKILEIFKVARDGEAARYEQFNNLSNRRLLWHGSRTTNYAGILSQGLRIAPPEAPVTGYMFGKGIYFADMVSKSANYCCTTKDDTEGLLLLCEVALGNIENKIRAEEFRRPPKGKHSVWGVGKTQPDPNQMKTLEDGVQVPLGKPVQANQENTSLRYNEFIVYDVNQVKIKYLLKLDFKYKY